MAICLFIFKYTAAPRREDDVCLINAICSFVLEIKVRGCDELDTQ